MRDNNNVEMKTGDIVEIKNAYFKNDNGIYFVRHTPGDVSWCGSDYSLTKMCKNGNLSTAARNIAFWPLSAFTSNRQKNAECRTWNKEHATIEIIFNMDDSQVIKHFQEKAEQTKQEIEVYNRRFGEEGEVTNTSKKYLQPIHRSCLKNGNERSPNRNPNRNPNNDNRANNNRNPNNNPRNRNANARRTTRDTRRTTRTNHKKIFCHQ